MYKTLGIPPAPGELDPPYPPWPLLDIQTVEEAIAKSWEYVKADATCGPALATADETTITVWLEEALNRILQNGSIVVGFDQNHYESPKRESSVVNYDETKIQKSPDFLFRRAGEKKTFRVPHQFGLIIECKIVDATHSLSLYVTQGIDRFVCGDYAWAMRHAGMVAYVRSPPMPHLTQVTDLDAQLKRTIAATTYGASVNLLNGPAQCPMTNTHIIFNTTHARAFVLNGGSQPGQIELRHLWLSL